MSADDPDGVRSDGAGRVASAPADVIYVCGPQRSGSTLLDQLLASSPEVTSVGEAWFLRAYANQDRREYAPVHELLCTCGESVSACAFWRAVERALGRRLAALRLRPLSLSDTRDAAWTRAYHRALHAACYRVPGLYAALHRVGLSGDRALVSDSNALFDAILAVSQARYVLDSSKSPMRIWSLLKDARAGRFKVLYLTRDYPGVCHSLMRRGVSLSRSAAVWRRTHEQMRCAWNATAPDRRALVRYEDLCERPDEWLARISAFLGIAFRREMQQRASGLHHIGGSPSKFDADKRAIAKDESFRSALSSAERRALDRRLSRYAEAWLAGRRDVRSGGEPLRQDA